MQFCQFVVLTCLPFKRFPLYLWCFARVSTCVLFWVINLFCPSWSNLGFWPLVYLHFVENMHLSSPSSVLISKYSRNRSVWFFKVNLIRNGYTWHDEGHVWKAEWGRGWKKMNHPPNKQKNKWETSKTKTTGNRKPNCDPRPVRDEGGLDSVADWISLLNQGLQGGATDAVSIIHCLMDKSYPLTVMEPCCCDLGMALHTDKIHFV